MWILTLYKDEKHLTAFSVYSREVLEENIIVAVLKGYSYQSREIPEYQARFLPPPDPIYSDLLEDHI